jgi:putative DNA primase/helicase
VDIVFDDSKFNNIPEHMRSRKQWVMWISARGKNDKLRKQPKQVNYLNAEVNDPATWCSFDDALAALKTNQFSGIGYVFGSGDGLVAIDLDHCFDENKLPFEWAQEIIELFSGTYSEYSVSGDGVHFVARGHAVRTGSTKWKDEYGVERGFEVYDQTSPRYFCMTGEVLFNNDITDCQDQIQDLYDRYYPDQDEFVKPPSEQQWDGADRWTDSTFVMNALKLVPAEVYEDWVAVGMALKAGGFPVELWDEWSKSSDKYEDGLCEKKWDKFEPRKITMGKIRWLVGQYAPEILKTGVSKSQVTITKLIRSEIQPPPPPKTEYLPSHTTVQTAGTLSIGSGASVLEPIHGSCVEHPRWRGKGISTQFRLAEVGLLKLSEDKPNGELIAGPIFVTHNLSNPEEKNAGLLIELQNRDGDYIEYAMPRRLLHEHVSILAGTLAECNFYIRAGKEKDLLVYLAESDPKVTRVPVAQTGWINSEKLAYVYTDGATDQNYQLQTGTLQKSNVTAGSLSDWIENVWVPASESPYGIFMVCAALSGVLLKAAQQDTGGFHLAGGSSSGKTTALQIAASVHGNGADPAESSESAINKWNTTINALEGLAAASNDSALCLDELGQCTAKDFGKGIYDLSGGQGKSALDSKRQMKARRYWRAVLLSTGETTSKAKIEEAVPGKKAVAKAGQLLRLIDLVIRKPIFGSRQLVDVIKRNCALYHGTLGKEYISKICAEFNTLSFRDVVQKLLDKSVDRLVKQSQDQNDGGEVSSVEQRALKRFALAEAAGLLLVHFDLIPGLRRETILEAIDDVVAEWKPSAKDLLDSERAIDALREYILTYRDSRFKTYKEYDATDKLNREIAGYYYPKRDTFCILPAALRDATGADPKALAEVLKEKKWLLYDRGKLTYRIRLDGRQVPLYGIKADLLGEGDAITALRQLGQEEE